MLTVQDLVDYLRYRTGAVTDKGFDRESLGAIEEAYRDVYLSHTWSCRRKFGRIHISAPYSTGTVTYDHTGGTYERQLTLSGGTWPSWAAQGVVRVGTLDYSVDERKSDTVLTLDSQLNPGDDLASSTFVIYRDRYDLPADLQSQTDFILSDHYGEVTYMIPSELLASRSCDVTTGKPEYYTIMESPDTTGRLAIYLHPYPDSAISMDFHYFKSPRLLAVPQDSDGKVSFTSGGSTVTGTSTEWNIRGSLYVGAVLRVGSPDKTPTGFSGGSRYIDEHIISSVESDTSLTVEGTLGRTVSSYPYLISDRIDIDENSMGTLMRRACDRSLAISQRDFKNLPVLEAQYMRALDVAKSIDKRNFVTGKVSRGRTFSSYSGSVVDVV